MVDIDSVNAVLMADEICKLGASGEVECNDDEVYCCGPEELVSMLETYFSKFKPSEMGVCTTCGGKSPIAQYESCPFCGEGDDGPEVKETIKVSLDTDAKQASVSKVKGGKEIAPSGQVLTKGRKKGNVIQFPVQQELPVETKPKGKPGRPAKAKEEPKAKGKVAKIKEEPKPKGKPGRPAKAKEEPKAKEESKQKGKPGRKPKVVETSALVPTEIVHQGEIVVRTEDDLNKAVETVLKLRDTNAATVWALGKYLREEIYTTSLWKQRKGSDGTPAYKNFDQFTQAELGVGRDTAKAWMDTSESYSEKEFLAFGYTKLKLALKVPTEHRLEIEEKIRSGASRAEVAETVDKIREEKGITKLQGETRVRKTASLSSASFPKKQEYTQEELLDMANPKFTVVSVRELVTAPLVSGLDKTSPARRMEDAPEATIRFENETIGCFRVETNAAGELVLRIQFSRAGDVDVLEELTSEAVNEVVEESAKESAKKTRKIKAK